MHNQISFVSSFSKMNGSTGVMRCTIPPGRKDGRKAKGSAFDIIVGIGDKAGEEYAALNVLHQVERGKPLERLLAPEFKGVWLDLDIRFQEVEQMQTKKTENAERRKFFAEKRAKSEKSKESATISISAASRQMIEDALLEQKAVVGSSSTHLRNSEQDTAAESSDVQQTMRMELISLGFAEYDAFDASRMFSSITEAVDYLCLNLDESELPKSFAPTSEVEVVQFLSNSSAEGSARINTQTRDKLTSFLCLSKYAAEKAIRKADGDHDTAFSLLYDTLTHNLFLDERTMSRNENVCAEAAREKAVEEESLRAIYGDDVSVGVGALAGFETKWAAVIRSGEGFPGIGYAHEAFIAIVDVSGTYPFTAPAVLVSSSFKSKTDAPTALSTAQKRMLMRASAGEISKLRDPCDMAVSEPVPLIYNVVSFLASATRPELISNASGRVKLQTQPISETKDHSLRLASVGNSSNAMISKLNQHRRHQSPLSVSPLPRSAKLDNMRERRKLLPAHASRAVILTKIKGNQVVVVSGATGSGKTTQVPQFLLEEAAETGKPTAIVCTQPRRIAAISVAERVAAERCQKVGESVGYQVKLNVKRSRNTRLLFCTTGVLLRRLQGDPKLESITHVLVDEVHERSVETDFLLLLLREIIPFRPQLRVVLMSATLDAEKFSNYFVSSLSKRTCPSSVPVVSIPGRTFPVEQQYLADAIQQTGYRLKPGDRFAKRSGKVVHHGKYGPAPLDDAIRPLERKSASEAAAVDDPIPEDYSDQERFSVSKATEWNDHGAYGLREKGFSNAGGREELKRTLQTIDESQVNVDLINKLVKQIDADGRRARDYGAILIFLPGAAEISSVIQKLRSEGGANDLLCLPLHSMLSPDEQGRVFEKAPNDKRKVICATNIAETSITVEDVTVVIDTLRAKEMGYDSLNGTSVLEECFISKAAAKQRAGRAGRVSKGKCYRLVRQTTFENRLAAQQTPEIQRVALEHLVLNILSVLPESQSRNDPCSFLSKAMDPPEPGAVEKAVQNLIDIGALRSNASGDTSTMRKVELTALGKHLTGLPVDARIGKLLIYGAIFGCMDPALTIAATLSERSPFYAPFEKREEARAAKLKFAWGKSDLLTFVRAFNAWRELREGRQGYAAEIAFCAENFISRKGLQSIADNRKQLEDAIADAGFSTSGSGGRGWSRDDGVNRYSNNVRVLRAIVCAALYPNVLRIDLPDTTYHEVAGGTVANKYNSKDLRLRCKTGERVFLHPESVNFHEGNYNTRWLAYFQKVKTTKLFIRDSTMVSPYAILLFGGEIDVQHKKGQMSVDKWVLFKSPARVAVLARELRRELDGLLSRKFEQAEMNLNEEGRAVNDAIIRLITLES